MIAKVVTRIAAVAAVLILATTSSEVLGAEVVNALVVLPEATEAYDDASSEKIILASYCSSNKSDCSSDKSDCDCESPCEGDVGCCSRRGCYSCYRGPQYYAMGEFVLYDRNNRSTRTPLLEDNSLNPLLFTDDLDFDYEPGVRVRLGRKNGPCSHCDACEIEYLGIFDWDASATLVDSNNLNLPGALGSGVVNGIVTAEEVRINYESSLHSIEANCVKCYCDDGCRRVELLCGFRYLRLDENLNIASNNVNQVDAIYDIDVDNNLYGFQVGVRARGQCSCRWGWEAVGKAGSYGNDARQSQFIIDNLPGTPFNLRPPTGASEGSVAFVGELSLTPMYKLNEIWTLRGGYNLLWIEGVALAPDQLDFTDTPTSGTSIDTGSGVFAHGFSAGLEARF